MTLLTLMLLAQVHGDTLRWYNPETVGYFSLGSDSIHDWAVIFPIGSTLDGRKVHSGRVHIYQPMDIPGLMKLCWGTLELPEFTLDSGIFLASDSGFQEVFFEDSIVLNEGDLIWLWCHQVYSLSDYPMTMDAGPVVLGYGDLLAINVTQPWLEAADFGFPYNWVMELILTPLDVEEGPAKPTERFALIPVRQGFWITGYSGPTQIYDLAGRLILKQGDKGQDPDKPAEAGGLPGDCRKRKGEGSDSLKPLPRPEPISSGLRRLRRLEPKK